MPAELRGDQERRSEQRGDIGGVVDSIRAIVKSLRDSGCDTEQRLGITSAQLYVLQELKDSPASINELAVRTYTHQSSVSMVVARLVENKLVTRTAARGDARKLSISLTPAGRSFLRRAPDVAQMRLINALRGLSRGDLKTLSTQLGNVVSIMENQTNGSAKLQRKISATI